MSASTILTRLKRTHYDISPEEYWDKWGLPSDYPMVAPAMPPRVRIWPKAMRLGNAVLDLTARQLLRRMIAPQVANLGFEREISMGPL